MSAILSLPLASVAISLHLVEAQKPPPPGGALCAEADPARAIHLALNDDRLIIAVVEATAAPDVTNGTAVQVIRVIEGAFSPTSTIADKQPALTCLSEGIWNSIGAVIGVFLVEDEQLFTLVAWPFVTDGAQTSAGPLSIDELLALGRSFVEPTPTALPAGVPPPPGVVPPGAGQGTDDRPQSSGGGSDTAAWLGALGAASLAGAGVLYVTRRRR